MFCMGNFQKEHLNEDSSAKKIQNYIFKYEDILGTGNFGVAYRGHNINNGIQVAIKVIKMSSLKSQISQKLLQNQISVLKSMKDHQNILKCYDVFTSINHCYIVTELCHHDLQKQLKQRGFFEQKQISRLIYDIYKGIQQLGKNSIIHRDIKTSNIFISQNGKAKIADFGFAIKANSLFKDLNIGSPLYMSPEGLIRNEYGPKTDVWSFGVLIYELLHGQTPLEKCKTDQQLKSNIFGKIKFNRNISNQLKQLILLCLNIDQKSRISFSQISETQYMKKITFQIQGKPHIIQDNNKRQYQKSTQCSTEFMIQSQMRILKYQINYNQTVSLLHFCRLIHKTCKIYPSSILSQFLLNISYELIRAKISNQGIFNQQHAKLKQVLKEYYRKFQIQNEDLKLYMNFVDAFREIQKLIKKYGIKKHLQILKHQVQLLSQCIHNKGLDYYQKVTKVKQFLAQI